METRSPRGLVLGLWQGSAHPLDAQVAGFSGLQVWGGLNCVGWVGAGSPGTNFVPRFLESAGPLAITAGQRSWEREGSEAKRAR